MTKTYRINGREVSFDGGGVIQELLEALSDKEEGNRKCEHGVYPIYECKKCIKQALEEPKQEKCNWKPDGTNTEKCSKCDKWKYWYEEQTTSCQPKQEECKQKNRLTDMSYEEAIATPGIHIINHPKQSTSLEGKIERIIGLHTHEDRIDKTDIAEDVLSLIQSHLIKEIEMLMLDGFMHEATKKRIIKIINNIC